MIEYDDGVITGAVILALLTAYHTETNITTRKP